MDFDYNDEQKMFKQGARDFFEKEVPKSLVKKMAQLGWLGLIYPEQYGGSGGNIIDLIALEEEMGRACYRALSSPRFCWADFLS